MNESRICPKCGAGLPRDVMEGLCPKCMARVVFGEGEVAETKPEEGPAATIQVEPDADPTLEHAGMRIGRYKLLEQIGEGGFGVVYMAEQVEPVQRKVALKVIKAGMDSKEVIARFEAERQALALMDHPNIAKILDAGVTDTPHPVSDHPLPVRRGEGPGEGAAGYPRPSDGRGVGGEGFSAGRPYFVMELVKGMPITDFCDLKHLSTAERLELFMKVCSAVQHAHQKGIIHRDIKPSNVLVTLHDGTPVPKVIDFGIAKALGPKLTEKTLFTGFAHLLGTPTYMSPEQAELSGLDIDTRSDIYSLGVLLYELLTGATPFEREVFAKAALDEIRRMIRETEPPKPSTRLSQELVAADVRRLKSSIGRPPTEDETRASSRRLLQIKEAIRLVRGDLDWIVMKCLEKDRKRRYETANGLAMDPQRHLQHEPVSAAAPSVSYRTQKFIARNKTALAVAVAMLLLLVVGTIVSTWQAVRATHAEKIAQTEASKSSQVAKFLKSMLEGVGPSVALGRNTELLREILDQAAERISEELQDQPEVEAELRSIMGEVYRDLGDYEKAEEMHQAALSIWQSLRGNQDVDVAKTLSNLGLVYQSQSRMEEAKASHEQAVAILSKLLDEQDEDVLIAKNNLAMVLSDLQEYEKAEELFRQILTISTNTLGDHKHTADTFNNLAWVRANRGDLAEALSLNQMALQVRQRLYEAPHPDIAASLSSIGLIRYYQGNFHESETSHIAAVEMFRKVLPEKHPDLATALNNLALVYDAQGQWNKAEELNLAVLSIRREVLSAEHFLTALTLNNLAGVLHKQGNLEQAEDYQVQALEMQRKLWGEHMNVVGSLTSLALLLRDRGNPDAAETNALEALEMFRRLKLNNPDVEAKLLNNLALILGDKPDLTKAEELHRQALEMGSNSPPNDRAIWLNNIANVRELRGDLTNALTLHLQALALRTNVFDHDHPEVAASLDNLARVLLKQGRPVEAQQPAQECLEIWQRRDPDDWRLFNAQSLLGGSFLGQKQYTNAVPLLVEGYNGLKQREGKIPRSAKLRLQEAGERLVQLYEQWDKPAEAKAWRDKLK